MKIHSRHLAITISFLILVGCVGGGKKGQSVQSSVSPAAVEQSPAQICQAVQENQVRANDYYINKSITLSGQVRSINEGYLPRFRIYLLANTVHVHASTQNLEQVKQLNVGQNARVSGVVESVAYKYDGCSITLKNAVF